VSPATVAAARRICFVNRYCYPDSSATSQLLTDLAGELSSRGWQVTMVGCRQRYDDPTVRLPVADRWRGVEIRRVSTTRFGRGTLTGRAVDYASFYLGLVPTLWRILRRGDLVVAKTDPPLLGLVVRPIAWLRGARTVNWLQDLFPEIATALGQPKLPAWAARLLRRMRDSSLRAAAANVAIGQRMRRYLVERGIPDGKLAIIPNWPHEDAIRPLPKDQSVLRSRLGLQDRFVVGYSGNLGRVHEWKPLFDAARLLATDPGIVFLIGGGGHGYDALKREAGAAGLGNILFQLETLSDSMAAADLHLVSLRPELEGLVVPSKFYGIAAAARAVGFVGDPDGELARLVGECDCGFSVPAGRGDLLAAAIASLALEPERAQAQGARARVLLEQRFSRAAAHQQWHHLLAGLADAAPARP
jgi:colanic acid biosynthesis glycosyl transferase WcaI